ncbi:MAG: hypothetical protein LC655_01750, partial [Bacteroidales bacterium]|nr:hypothetical protein [Bacteroidales bacterium]
MPIISDRMFIDQLFHTTTTFTWIIAGILSISLLIQLIYYLFVYSRMAGYRNQDTPKSELPVSVIICARNEADNLRKNLPS